MAKKNDKKSKKDSKDKREEVTIKAPNMKIATFRIRGTEPLCINRFANKDDIIETQREGQKARNKKKHGPRDFEADYENAKHVSVDKWLGFHAAAIRNACISACRISDFVMTKAKLCIFCLADGYSEDGTPLVRITKGKPKMVTHNVRNKNGNADIRARPMWEPGWEATVRIRYDADQFDATSIANLLNKVGVQVGICEGRPDSKDSAGMLWGLFEII